MYLHTQTAPQSQVQCYTDLSGSGPSPLVGTQKLLHFPVPVVSAGWPSTTLTAEGLGGKLLPHIAACFQTPLPHSTSATFNLCHIRSSCEWKYLLCLLVTLTMKTRGAACIFLVPSKSFLQIELTCKMRKDD